MEETTPNGPMGPQLYILSHGDYAELCNIRTMLIQMAQEVYDEDQPNTGNKHLLLDRAELYFFLMQISVQIHDAITGVHRENLMSPRSSVWQ